ncbi:unnamed protein product [Laminaria digitata]
MSTPTVSAFSSLDAHNGCRALFNGSKGWAYIGPTGQIDPADYPGTVSYDYGGEKSPRGGGGGGGIPPPAHGQGHTARGAAAAATPSRPGEGVGRKTNDVRCAYLDAADLEHLLHEVERCAAADADAAAAAAAAAAGTGEVAGGEPRRGRPIVLTLQAILAATSPPTTMAATSASEFEPNSDSATECAADFAADSGVGVGAAAEDKVSVSGGVIDAAAAVADEAVGPGKGVGFSGASDLAHFPPLALLAHCSSSPSSPSSPSSSSSGRKGGLFLAPPITMVKGGGAGEEEGNSGGGGGGLVRGVSCSEAVAATSVAEAAQVGGGGSGGGGGGGGAGGGLKAAAGQGGKAADERGGGEDEDPYYARKRVGAFAFKTKPRGKAHK